MQITTKSGFSCDIDPDVLNNMELVDDLADVQAGNTLAISRVCLKLLGNKDNRARLYDHVRNGAGRVPPDKVDAELGEILKGMGQPGKN